MMTPGSDFFNSAWHEATSLWHGAGAPQAWLAARSSWREQFLNEGLPGADHEAWKYTNLGRWLTPQSKIGLLKPTFGSENFSGQSQPGVKLNSLGDFLAQAAPSDVSRMLGLVQSDATIEADGTIPLSLGLATRGYVLRVTQGVQARELIRLPRVHAAGTLFSSLSMIWVEAGASARVWENSLGDLKDGFSAQQILVVLEENAQLDLVRSVTLSAGTSLSRVSIYQERSSRLRGSIAVAGGDLVRESWVISQKGEGAESDLHAVTLTAGNQHVDLRTVVRHLKPQGRSVQLIKAMAKGSGRSIFNGKVFIAEGAQQVDSSQLSQNLLLSPKAEIDTRPELDVRADNVKAGHGASVGRLDPEELFYFQSRGIAPKLATRMLAEGFVRDGLGEFATSADLAELWRHLRQELEA